MLYEELLQQKRLPTGTYIFSDVERLTPKQAELAAKVWDQLANAGKDIQLLNHPTRSMRRYELLRTLYERDLNQFNVYRLTEVRQPQRFPVFVRNENDHAANRTPLLKTQQELNEAIERFNHKGKSRDEKIITEFCDTSDEKGVFRKYTAFLIGDQIIPRSVFFGGSWMLKAPGNTITDAQTLQEEQEFIETNPHEAQLREVFQLANIQYGRIDYSMLDGKPQVWEINTNPDGMRVSDADRVEKVFGLPIGEYFTKEFGLAFEAIDCKAKSNIQIAAPAAPQTPLSRKFKLLNEDILVLLLNRVLPLLPPGAQMLLFKQFTALTNSLQQAILKDSQLDSAE